jgi:acyl-CoA thioester hydrolase
MARPCSSGTPGRPPRYTHGMANIEQVMQQGYAEARVRVRYAETDQMGVVYHANYFVWFEVGRVEFIAVVEATARYKVPARYDEELLVRTSLSGVRGPIIRFKYAIVRATDQVLLCEGETVHIVVGRDMKTRDMPASYAERFATLVKGTRK